jgi:hypothetical protein
MKPKLNASAYEPSLRKHKPSLERHRRPSSSFKRRLGGGGGRLRLHIQKYKHFCVILALPQWYCVSRMENRLGQAIRISFSTYQ